MQPEKGKEVVEWNINDNVYVKLSKRAREYLNLRQIPFEVDAEGWTQFQGWVLFDIFGHMIYLGCDPPFETTVRVKCLNR